MWDAADTAALLDPDLPGYALASKADGSTVGGIFRRPGADVFNGMVTGTSPSFYCLDSTAPAHGEALSIIGLSWVVIKRSPDGYGMTTLTLEES